MKNIYSGFIISIIFLISSCGKGGGSNPTPVDPCAGLSVKYSTDVLPIINTSCAASPNCHATGSQNSGGPLTDYNKIYAKRSATKYQVSGGFMPKGASLTTDQKNKIICWINSGAPNN